MDPGVIIEKLNQSAVLFVPGFLFFNLLLTLKIFKQAGILFMISPAKLLIYRMTQNSSKYFWRALVLFSIFILDVIHAERPRYYYCGPGKSRRL